MAVPRLLRGFRHPITGSPKKTVPVAVYLSGATALRSIAGCLGFFDFRPRGRMPERDEAFWAPPSRCGKPVSAIPRARPDPYPKTLWFRHGWWRPGAGCRGLTQTAAGRALLYAQ